MHVFISYACADGRDLAEQLYADLLQRGVEPWLDRERIEGGAVWTVAIEQAIDGCDSFVALMSPKSFTSRICRDEQLRALRKEKHVIPLLAHAGTDRPLHLESAHYIDFTATADYAARFAELLAALRNPGSGVRLRDLDERTRRMVSDSGLQTVSEVDFFRSTWADIRRRSQVHADRYLRELRGSADRSSTYIAECFVPRAEAARELNAFLGGDREALVLVGNSGVGKSTLLCHSTLHMLEDGDAVFFYACGGSLPVALDDEVARDLGADDADQLEQALDRVDSLAKEAGRKLVLVFDGVNDFHAKQGSTPSQLLRRLDQIVSRLKGDNVRVLISCGSSTWTRLLGDRELDLFWSRYYASEQDLRAVELAPFDDGEAAEAYRRYREFFGLHSAWEELLPDLRMRLHEPLMMRLLAETYSGRPEPIHAVNLTFGVLTSYVSSRTTQAGRTFLDRLASLMIEGRRATLPVSQLKADSLLGPMIEGGVDDSPYRLLLDAGILSESGANNLFAPTTLRFTQARVGAFVVASYVARSGQVTEQTFVDLADQSTDFPMAWDVAVILLPAVAEESVFVALGSSRRSDLRELATQGLREVYADDVAKADAILRRLVSGESDEGRRTALKAAFNIGPGAKPLFLHAALTGSRPLKDALRDVLYMIWRTGSRSEQEEATSILYLVWRHDPAFTSDLLQELVARIGWLDLLRAHSRLSFFCDLTITIYVNHCERADVVRLIDELYYRLLSERLPLKLIRSSGKGRVFRAVVGMLGTAFARPVLDWMGIDDGFFELPLAERQRLARAAEWLNPIADFADHAAELEALLAADRVVFRGTAALVAASHAYRNFTAAEPILRRIASTADARARLWLLLGFCVLLPDTPREWGTFLESLTADVLDDSASDAALDRDDYAQLVLLPIGLAAGKSGESVPLLEKRLREDIIGGRLDSAAKLVRNLGPVAFYYPDVVCRILQAALPSRQDARLDEALIYCFARMRALYLDAADHFMNKLGIGEVVQRRAAAEADVSLVQKYVRIVGLYNNALHLSVYYPKMRRAFSAGALELLATTASRREFVGEYGGRAVQMLDEADFRLASWTEADAANP